MMGAALNLRAGLLAVVLMIVAGFCQAALGGEIGVRVLGSDASKAAVQAAPGARLVEDDGPADLIWDTNDGAVLTGDGEMAAEGIETAEIAAVVAKWSAARAVARMAAAHPLALEMTPEGSHHTFGTRVRFRSGPLAHPNIVVFNLAANGSVHLLYPDEGEPADLPVGSRYELPLNVSPPAGADHLFVITANEPLDGLIVGLRSATARDVDALLATQLEDKAYQIGAGVLYSAKPN
jgi:hypothetical protein